MQHPKHVRSTAQFDHIKRGLKVGSEDDSLIRNSNSTLDKVLAQNRRGYTSTVSGSRRELALAQLQDSLRQKRLAKAKTTVHQIIPGKKIIPIANVLVRYVPAPRHVEFDIDTGLYTGSMSAGAAHLSYSNVKLEKLDWRLQGPTTQPAAPSFKPGTSTWDTDTFTEAQKIKKATVAFEREDLVYDGAAKHTESRQQQAKPAEWWTTQYKPRYEESVQTVGHAARCFTSTTAAVSTKNEFVRMLKSRCDDHSINRVCADQ